jgi:arylsulfatase A-like enzyme
MPDESYSRWAAEMLQKTHDKPFILGVGYMRPHTPLYVPQKYFDLFPLDRIQLPPYKEDDLDDCREFVHLILQYGFERHELYRKADLWKRFIQAYLAAVAFADAQVGVLLEALDKGPHRDNTLIILTSDHGFHMGEKRYNFKLTNWEESTRVPFIVVPPGARKSRAACNHPISLIDVYPTLVDYCGLPSNPNLGKSGHALDGHSVRPFVDDPAAGKWDGPDVALIAVFGEGKKEGGEYHNFSVRGERWRYTLYENGAEELYDHRNDPNEWTNLAGAPEHAQVRAELKKTLLHMLGRE